MVKKTSYLSQPQNVGMGIAIPKKLRIDARKVPEILKKENFLLDLQDVIPREYDYQMGRAHPDYQCCYHPQTHEKISLTELFSRLEEIERIEISEGKGFFDFSDVSRLLCDVIGFDYDNYSSDVFGFLSLYFGNCNNPVIIWEKTDDGFNLIVSFGTAFEKKVEGTSLMKCFEELDFFFFR